MHTQIQVYFSNIKNRFDDFCLKFDYDALDYYLKLIKLN